MSDNREEQVLRQVEEVFNRLGIDTARDITIGGLKASLVAYGYVKAVVVLLNIGKTDSSVSFSSVAEAITLRSHAADALDRQTVAVLLTTERVPDAVRAALRERAVTVIQLTEDDARLRRPRQELREFAVVV